MGKKILPATKRTIPRPFSFEWGKGQVIEEASIKVQMNQHSWEPAVQLLQFDDGYANFSTMILSLLAGVLVSYGAAYGGSLVYDYQFNVESLDGSTAWDETETDQLPGDKTQRH